MKNPFTSCKPRLTAVFYNCYLPSCFVKAPAHWTEDCQRIVSRKTLKNAVYIIVCLCYNIKIQFAKVNKERD